MPTKSFDSLLSALSASVTDAQRALSRHHQGQLRRLYSDESGQSLTWTFYVPTDEDDQHYQPVELPLVSLRSPRELSISELSISFSGSIEPASASELRVTQKTAGQKQDMPTVNVGKRDERPLALLLKSAGQALASRLVSVKVLLRLDKPLGRVLVNGRELKRFEIDDD